MLQYSGITYPLNGIVTDIALSSFYCFKVIVPNKEDCRSLYAITLLGYNLLRHDLCADCCWSKAGTSTSVVPAKEQLLLVITIPGERDRERFVL